MPRLRNKLHSYCLHNASGQAVVWFGGREHYLGKYGSPESHAAYRRLVVEWTTTKRPVATPRLLPKEVRADLRVGELLVAYLDFAKGYYVKNGRPTGEYGKMRDAIRSLREFYETTPVWEFGPAALRIVREQMIAANLSRKVVNARIHRVRRIFKWGVERELVEASVLQELPIANRNLTRAALTILVAPGNLHVSGSGRPFWEQLIWRRTLKYTGCP